MNSNNRVSLYDYMVLVSHFKMSRLRRRCSICDCTNLATGWVDCGTHRIYICENHIQEIIEQSTKPFDYDLL
jgi:hypothetical protein